MPGKKWIGLVCSIYVVALLVPAVAGAAVPDPTVLWWKFDEGSGSVATDSSGKGHDGVITGAQWRSGGVGGLGYCLDFTGSSTTVEDKNAPSYINGLGAITISLWVKSRVTNSDKGFIIGEAPAGNDNQITMRYDAAGANGGGTNVLKLGVTSTSGLQQLESSSGAQTTEWQHVAMTWKGGEGLKFYNNGKLDTPTNVQAVNTGTISGVATLIVGQGGKDAGAGWDGLIDDVRIYDTVLTAAQVAELAANKPITLKASAPIPADGTLGVATPLMQWTKGDTAIFHNVYFGTSADLGDADRVAANQPFAVYYRTTAMVPGTTYYWRVDEVDATGNVITGDVWSFMTEPVKAYAPKPADGGADLFPAGTLTWSPGKSAFKHQVYFSSVQADVAGGAAAADQGQVTATTYATDILRSSTTYYWRVDEIKFDGSVEPGEVWSFTTADGVTNKIVRQWWTNISGTAVNSLTGNAAYPNSPTGTELLDSFEGPTDWADNYGTRMYGWLTPPQSGDYTFWIASDDASELWLSTDADPANAVVIARVGTYTASQEWTKEAGQKSAAIPLQAGTKYFIQALQKEGTGGDNLAVSWQGPGIASQQIIKAEYVDTFAMPALQAYSPNPLNKAVEAPYTGSLSWSAGEKAQKHDVYFGDDEAAVAAADTTSPLYQGQQSGTAFEAGELEWDKTYYWRVDEINASEADSPWKGTVWSFTTANFIPVDDMESYNDDDNRIYDTWLDNYGDDSGSVVGNDPAPFAERTIVHGGKQSLPMVYNNAGPQHLFSEIERTFDSLQNWTVNGVTDLSLWVRGNPVSFVDKGNEAFTVSASGHDIWDNADDFRLVYKKLSGNGSVVVKVESLANSNGWAKAGVMIRDSLDAGSPMAYMIQSVANGVSFGWRQTAGAAAASVPATAGVTAPQWVKLTRTGNAFTAQYSADGKTWTDIKDATTGAPASTTITMGASVYVGLCVTSHNSAATTTAELSGAALTGSVSGAWQQAWIGDDPDLTNAAANLYVVVQDSSGKSATAADATAVNAATWTNVKFPLSSFTGVNLSKVKTLYLGVGDRNATTPGGSGRILIDDIRVTAP